MEEKTRTIIISFAVFLLAIGTIYFLDMPKYKTFMNESKQLSQLNATMSSKKAYSDTINAEAKALEDAGYLAIEPSLAVNFTNTPFFIPKMSYFFQTMAGSSGMGLGTITYSAPTSVKGSSASSQAGGSGIKVSTVAPQQQETQTTTSSGSYGQLIGPVEKTMFNLTVTGTYDAFKTFLSQLENQTRIVTVNNITLSPAPPSGTSTQVTSSSKSKTKTTKTVSNISNFQLVVDAYSY